MENEGGEVKKHVRKWRKDGGDEKWEKIGKGVEKE